MNHSAISNPWGFRPRRAHLITGTAAGLQPLSMVPATEDLAILVEVDEIHQQLLTHAADKAIRVPAFSVTRPGSKHHDIPSVYLTTTLWERRGVVEEKKGKEKQQEQNKVCDKKTRKVKECIRMRWGKRAVKRLIQSLRECEDSI